MPNVLVEQLNKHAKKFGYKDRSELIRTACRLILEQPDTLVKMFFKKYEGEKDAGR